MAKAMKQMGAGDLSELAGLAGGGKGPMGLPSADPKNTGAKNGGAFPDFRDFR
jgi:hypothetical protein